MWLYNPGTQIHQNYILGSSGLETESGMVVHVNAWETTNGTVYFIGRNGTASATTYTSTAAGAFPFNTWNHFVLTGNTSTGVVRMYINGVERASGTMPAGININKTIWLGSMHNNAWNTWHGQMDDVQTYNRVLTPAEIQSMSTGGASAPVISNTSIPAGSIGVAYSFSIAASNTPTSYNATGLPAGLTINTSTGVISGTPSQTGTSNVTLSATNSGGSGTKVLSFTVTEPAGTVVCYRAPAMTINGNLSETGWNLSKSITKNTIGTGNNTATFGVMWDNTNLYIGGRVLDGNLYSDSPNSWDDDALEVFIDANNNKATGYDAGDNQVIKNWNKSTVFTRTTLTGLQHAWAAVTGGYTIELAVPWSSLGISAPANGTKVGIDVGYNDDDNGGGRESQAVWFGNSNNYINTSAFGTLVLSSSTGTVGSSFSSISIIESGELRGTEGSGSVQLAIYPNPASGKVKVVMPDDIGEYRLSMNDMQGRPLQETKGSEKEVHIDLSGIVPGLYIIQVNAGNRMAIKKLIIK